MVKSPSHQQFGSKTFSNTVHLTELPDSCLVLRARESSPHYRITVQARKEGVASLLGLLGLKVKTKSNSLT